MQTRAWRLRSRLETGLLPRARPPRIWHRRCVTVDVARAAFQRVVDALNRARDPVVLRAALADDIALARHAPGERGGAPVVESFAGIAEVERWFARTPPAVQFSLAGAPWPEPGDGWGIEYAYDAGDFHNGGIWIAHLACDGRIAQLSHHPFALRTPHAHGGAGHSHGG
jgi:hypothetical protein